MNILIFTIYLLVYLVLNKLTEGTNIMLILNIIYALSYALILLIYKHSPMAFPNKHINSLLLILVAAFAPILVLLFVLINFKLIMSISFNLIKAGYYKLCH